MTPAEQTIIARMTGREWMSAAEILGPDGGPERVRLRAGRAWVVVDLGEESEDA